MDTAGLVCPKVKEFEVPIPECPCPVIPLPCHSEKEREKKKKRRKRRCRPCDTSDQASAASVASFTTQHASAPSHDDGDDDNNDDDEEKEQPVVHVASKVRSAKSHRQEAHAVPERQVRPHNQRQHRNAREDDGDDNGEAQYSKLAPRYAPKRDGERGRNAAHARPVRSESAETGQTSAPSENVSRPVASQQARTASQGCCGCACAQTQQSGNTIRSKSRGKARALAQRQQQQQRRNAAPSSSSSAITTIVPLYDSEEQEQRQHARGATSSRYSQDARLVSCGDANGRGSGGKIVYGSAYCGDAPSTTSRQCARDLPVKPTKGIARRARRC